MRSAWTPDQRYSAGASTPFVATLLRPGAAVGARLSAVLGRRPAGGRGRLAARAALLRLIVGERIADRGAHIAAGRLAVARLRSPVTIVRAPVGFVAVVRLHAPKRKEPWAIRRVSAIRNGWRSVWEGRLSGVPSASWTVSARADTVASLRQTVADFVIANGIAEPHVTDIELAVSEAATNAIMHAFRDRSEPGTVGVSVTLDDGEIEIVVRDDGSGMAPRDDSPGLGLGLPLIRRVADGFDHREPPDGGTELWMRFVLPHGV